MYGYECSRMSIPSGSDDHAPRPSSRLRTVIELGVSLVVLVVLFRTFLAGGYMIETGSMAPCLLGYHRQAVCPSCRYSFAVEGNRGSPRAACPNCGRTGISLEALPRNDGDHLLVEREGFALRPPRRWEVVVFRNPSRPTQAYVKRMIALPGETVEIIEGDIFVDGAMQTKPHGTQRGMRIPVYDHDFRPDPDDPDWQPRWVITGSETGWTAEGGAFRHAPPARAAEGDGSESLAWVEYRHWIRAGGGHRTAVAVPHWPATILQPERGVDQLTYDAVLGQLVCRGALPRARRDALIPPIGEPAFRQAIEQLYEASHVAPITDTYGYNSASSGGGNENVRDLMVELRLAVPAGAGEFAIELSDGTETLQCLFDFTRRRVQLIDTRTSKAVRTGDLPASMAATGALVEMSLMDRQTLVAIDGKAPFEPWSYPAGVERGPVSLRPVRFGARGAEVEVSALKLFRDVYYTSGDGTGDRDRGERRRLGGDEYFVLGDNSPVSKDSRSWPEGALLGRELFVGKPLVVHLPSRRARFRIGSWQTEIRIPDLSRIRYIR